MMSSFNPANAQQLICAIMEGDETVVRALLRTTDPNIFASFPLRLAVSNIIGSDAPHPIRVAIVQTLLDHGADANQCWNSSPRAWLHTVWPKLENLLTNPSWTAAAPEKKDHCGVLSMIKFSTANVMPECSPLYLAAGNNRVALTTMLLNHGADPCAENSKALRAAARADSNAAVRVLLNAGADACAENSEALCRASANNNEELFDLLYPLSNPQQALRHMKSVDIFEKEDRVLLEKRIKAAKQQRVLQDTLAASIHHASTPPRKI